MKFQLVNWINPGVCPECHAKSRQMWLAVTAGTTKVVCCEACGPKSDAD